MSQPPPIVDLTSLDGRGATWRVSEMGHEVVLDVGRWGEALGKPPYSFWYMITTLFTNCNWKVSKLVRGGSGIPQIPTPSSVHASSSLTVVVRLALFEN